MLQRKQDNIGILDFETDPFKRGRLPKPFIAGLYLTSPDYKLYKDYWTDDLNSKNYEGLIINVIDQCKNYFGYIYAHNGGRFDFIFMLEIALKHKVQVKNLRMIKNRVARFDIGQATFVDSFLLLPCALKATGEKEDIEYWKMEGNVENLTKEEKAVFLKDINGNGITTPRDRYFGEIRSYLKQDCIGAWNTIKRFIELYGFGLTIAGRAFDTIKKTGYCLPKYRKSSYSALGDYEQADQFFRDWYFGGRNQCFAVGHIKGDLHYLDINSAYPYAMTFDHWAGSLNSFIKLKPREFYKLKKREKQVCLYSVECLSYGAFPVRTKKGTSYPEEYKDFKVTGWELVKALELGLIENLTINTIFAPRFVANFKRFINDVYERRLKAKAEGNEIDTMIHKLVMNSGYGRFAINPRDWKDHLITPFGQTPPEPEQGQEPWELSLRNEELLTDFYERPSPEKKRIFHNVATAASITGFVRAMLMDAVTRSPKPLYCDTDSVISEGVPSLDIGMELGKWKVEATGTDLWIGGKKLYAFKQYNGKYKIASKGVKLEVNEIKKVANGQKVKWESIAPSYNFMRFPNMDEYLKNADEKDFKKIFVERIIERTHNQQNNDVRT